MKCMHSLRHGALPWREDVEQGAMEELEPCCSGPAEELLQALCRCARDLFHHSILQDSRGGCCTVLFFLRKFFFFAILSKWLFSTV